MMFLRRPLATLTLLFATWLWGASSAIAQVPSYCSACKHPTLARGVNMFDWFMGPNIYQEGHQQNYITPAQLKALKDRGFTHLRIPVYARFVADITQPGAPLNPWHMGALDTALQMVTAQGLSVVLVLNPEDDMYRLATSPDARIAYASLWRQLAARYHGYGTRQIYFEILNEPHFNAFMPDADARASWYALEKMLVSAIRGATSWHYLIVPAYDWDTVPSAVAFDPHIEDTRTLYTAHFYEFIAFTHQGLEDFGDPVVRALHGLPYPAQGTECQAAVNALPADIAAQMGWYCHAGFGPAMIDQQMRSFAVWAEQHRIPIYLGEFGAAPAHSEPASPARWITDVRKAAEKYRLPWSYWSYKGAMGLQGSDGMQLKPEVLQALGR